MGSDQMNVFFELTWPREFSISKGITRDGVIDNLAVKIPADFMDDIAIAWIKKRKLQVAVGGPVGNECGSPDCPLGVRVLFLPLNPLK
ncbi:hypothetical protein ASQ50_01280 [Marinobacter sp. LQ44]|nr:hypothetical protein ASQ50_01280 [Marinobacter sp. LQ44]